MASLNEIKQKIQSTKKTIQITNAMHTVSAAKLAKLERAAQPFADYAAKIRKITTDLLHGLPESAHDHPLLQHRPIKKIAYLVITSDKGLVGAYNSSILKSVLGLIEDDQVEGIAYALLAIGGIGADFFKRHQLNLIFEMRDVADTPSFDQVQQIISQAVAGFQAGDYDALYVCYHHHVNSMTSHVRAEQMLPIVDLSPDEAEEAHIESFELEPNRQAILDELLPLFAQSMIYGAILDAKTAESAAGMTAMRTATDNAKKIISDLTIQANRLRQAEITQEITEIVGGASALK